MKKQLQATITEVTPEMVDEWLSIEANYQRKVSWAWVQALADQADRGEFESTGQSMTLDWNGAIMDGRHRALMIKMTGRPMSMVVVTGEDPANFGVYDQGRRRTAAQFVEGRHGSLISGAVKLMLAYGQDPEMKNLTTAGAYYKSLGITSVIQGVMDYPIASHLAGEVAMVRNACRIHPSVLLAVTALGAEASPELVGDWLTGLAVGDGMQVGDPRLTLRNTYIQNYRSLNRSGGLRQSWYYVTRAWNAYVDGDELKLLRFMKRYEMPTIVGTV